jgi:hypothetical protein
MTKIELPLEVQVKAEAQSRFTLATIEDRLTVLRLRSDDAALEEIAYLERVKAEQFGKAE